MSRVVGRFTGTAIKRSEDPRILTGAGRYVDDITLPGMASAAFLRSPMAHARVVSVDASAARQLPGVLAVYTGAEMEAMVTPGGYGAAAALSAPNYLHSLLATDKVRCVGDLVALVVADCRYIAEDACELIEVEYEELTAVTSVTQAMAPDAPLIFDAHGSNVVSPSAPNMFGDVEAAFGRADRVLTATFHEHRHQNVPIETRGSIASYDDAAEQKFTLYTCTQGVFFVASVVAARLGIGPEDVRVLTADVGGSFGLKGISAGR